MAPRMWGKRRRPTVALTIALFLEAASPAASAVPVPIPSPLDPQDVKFSAFVHDFRQSALAAGISAATYDLAMAHVERNARIEQLNLNQPEFSLPIWSYLDTAVSDRRVSLGQQMLAANAPILAAIEKRFGVPKEILVAIWGEESNYGHGAGSFNMFEALATLAYDGPRVDYARPELIAALKMMQQEHYAPEAMTSSWAGAFGQTQFTPSTFLSHAVDGDGDGRIDLWGSPADALASAAAVLKDAGWKTDGVWGYEARLPRDFAYEQADLDNAKPIEEWRAEGVKTVWGADLPASEEPGAIYLPAGMRGPAFMTFSNFKVILKYNNAASYALAVCLLANRLKGGAPIMAGWPRDEPPMSREERLALQAYLLALGYDVGPIDGVLGRRSRAAIREYQKTHGIPADGFPTEDFLTRVAMDATAKR